MTRMTATHGTGGANQADVADHNARLVLTVLRQAGALPGADLARRTGLSPQGISTILRRLETDGLLSRGAPLRGQVGKPRVPVSIAPEGGLAFGLKIGRRSTEIVLADLTGRIRARREARHDYPLPDAATGFVRAATLDLMAEAREQGLDPDRICGLGVAMPFEIWEWGEHLGAPDHAFGAWRSFDLQAALAAICPWPVAIRNDVTSAARAELALGPERSERDWAYLFVGAFVGGGVVIDGRVRDGRRGNAGALGSLSTCLAGGTGQLIDAASLYLLERAAVANGRAAVLPPDALSDPGPALEGWLDGAARALAQAALDACSVIDFETVVIDGALPPPVRAELVRRVVDAMGRLDQRGLMPPAIAEGTLGASARALGAALAPLEMRYFLG